MKVSVITVCFNSQKYISECIDSVNIQSYNNIEHIFIDGNSTDKTTDIIKARSKRNMVFISEADNGIYDAMNKGLQIASGDIVGFLNSDDFFENSNIISDVIKHFKSNPTADLIFGDVVFVDPNDTKKIIRFYSSKKFKAWKLRFGWMPPHPATFIRKSIYDKLGNYSVDYKISADYELFVRFLMLHNILYSRIDRVLVRMRIGGVSTSGIKSIIKLNYEIVKACKQNGIYTNLFYLIWKIPFKILEVFKRP